ncbi:MULTISPECIES: hypothetical protein [unclassified Legionella]|uniref:hypothetical protein n=1 Tax=unclassified Legionella TaxID=2622702 RepID=UPI0010565E81|nr:MULTISPECIES: hypothetical protein [unclassified Legionella]MDI9817665.1 hypothetical protein [Legionella sp. PL877]
MGYEPPSYNELHGSTADLLNLFNRLSSCYHPPHSKILCEGIRNLEGRYLELAQNKEKGYSDIGLRKEQLTCITQLLDKLSIKNWSTEISDLEESLKKGGRTEEEIKQIREQINQKEQQIKPELVILLGAIFFRILRIEISYTGFWGAVSSCVARTSEDDSALQQSLKELLNIAGQNQLDSFTITLCCKAYLNYLKQPNVADMFSYIKKDKNKFLSNLESIVSEHGKKAKPMLQQIQVIKFVQSVSTALLQTEYDAYTTANALSGWMKARKEDFFTTEKIIKAMDSIKPKPTETVRLILRHVFSDKFFSKVTKEDVERYVDSENKLTCFTNEVVNQLKLNSQYALLGAYLIAYDECNPDYSHLKYALNQVVDMDKLGQEPEKIQSAFTALHNYMTLPGRPEIDCITWGSEDSLINRLVQLKAQTAPTVAAFF